MSSVGRKRAALLACGTAIAVAVAFVTVYFAQPLLGGQTVQAVTENGGDPDVANIFQPLHDYQYRYVRRHGELPEWIEPMGLGTPQIDLATTTNAYLPRLAVLRAAPSAQTAADLLAWGASLAAALGVLALARLYGLGWAATVLAAVSYPLAHAAVRWVPYFSIPVFMAAFPFVLLGIELVWRRRLLLGAGVGVAALGVGGLGGSVLFPQLVVQVAGLLVLYRLVVTPLGRRERLLRTGVSAATLLVGLVAAAAGWLPFLVSQHDTVRTATALHAIGGIDGATLHSLVDPTAQADSEGINGDLYVSLVAPLLLVAGLVLSVRSRVLGFVPLYALVLLLVGLKTPLLNALVAFVPGWEYLSSAERYVTFLAPLPLALLAGVGAEWLARPGRRGPAAAAALVVASVLYWQAEMGRDALSLWVLGLGSLTVLGLGAIVTSGRARTAAVYVPIALLPVAVAASLEERALGWHPVRDAPDAIYQPWLGLVAGHDVPEGRWMSYCQPVNYSYDPRESFTYRPNTFLHAPGRWLDTYVSFPRPDYYTYWQRLTGSERYSARDFGAWFQHTPEDPPPNLSLVNAAGVSRILASSECAKPSAAPWDRLASTPATPTPRTHVVYANPAAYPMAFVSHRWQVVPSDEDAVRSLATAANAGFAAHTDYVSSPEASPSASGEAPAPARLQRSSDGLQSISLPSSRSGGLLVVLDRYDKTWNAQVDGRDAKLVRVNGLFRGVFVPAGARTVTMRYEPWWTRWLFPLCWAVIACALLATVVAVLVERRGAWRDAGATGRASPTPDAAGD
jgi:hypothetical protein